MKRPGQITQLLNQWRSGDSAALEQILPAIYDELHRVARSHMRGESAPHTLQATALINEAFCRIGDVKSEIQDRGHFIGIVANVMRQILVDHARAKGSQKRGGDADVVPIDSVQVAAAEASSDILAIETVLKTLEKKDPRKVRIAELYYFCGTSYAETAATLDISEITVSRELCMLRALLARELLSDQPSAC